MVSVDPKTQAMRGAVAPVWQQARSVEALSGGRGFARAAGAVLGLLRHVLGLADAGAAHVVAELLPLTLTCFEDFVAVFPDDLLVLSCADLQPLRRRGAAAVARPGTITGTITGPGPGVSAERLARIAAVRDILPDLGAGFVCAALEAYADNVELTVAAMDPTLPLEALYPPPVAAAATPATLVTPGKAGKGTPRPVSAVAAAAEHKAAMAALLDDKSVVELWRDNALEMQYEYEVWRVELWRGAFGKVFCFI
jgi:hypothetical protein